MSFLQFYPLISLGDVCISHLMYFLAKIDIINLEWNTQYMWLSIFVGLNWLPLWGSSSQICIYVYNERLLFSQHFSGSVLPCFYAHEMASGSFSFQDFNAPHEMYVLSFSLLRYSEKCLGCCSWMLPGIFLMVVVSYLWCSYQIELNWRNGTYTDLKPYHIWVKYGYLKSYTLTETMGNDQTGSGTISI